MMLFSKIFVHRFLPTVVENWDTIGENIKENFIKANGLFCDLRFLAGLFYQTEMVL